ncbi:MAG: hypothetical protein CO093_02045 [Alphaproteobacteria bacterium CG_4_9_14_3_um_filter_47_13]|nr:MAG: hypothetical protein CO093_02045 [Alphaproteobacteria bacterium CG_4_9_14_3_um_filter_47_13]
MKRLTPFRQWLSANGIGVTKGYQLVAQNKLKTVKIGKNRFITEESAQAFIDNLNDEAENQGA